MSNTRMSPQWTGSNHTIGMWQGSGDPSKGCVYPVFPGYRHYVRCGHKRAADQRLYFCKIDIALFRKIKLLAAYGCTNQVCFRPRRSPRRKAKSQFHVYHSYFSKRFPYAVSSEHWPCIASTSCTRSQNTKSKKNITISIYEKSDDYKHPPHTLYRSLVLLQSKTFQVTLCKRI